MELGNKVKKRREELGLSQEDLAIKMGYKSRSSINKIENGRPISQKIIVRLAEILNVSIAYLMGWEENIENKPVETANKLADLVLSLECMEDNSDLITMLKEYQELSDTKKAQVREYVHLLSGKH